MTTYTISLGYMSSADRKKADEFFRGRVKFYRENPNFIALAAASARSHYGGQPSKAVCDTFKEYAECYMPGDEGDSTIRVTEDDEGETVVTQNASGGGEARRIKEELRRTFCRCILEDMNAEGYEVNISVSNMNAERARELAASVRRHRILPRVMDVIYAQILADIQLGHRFSTFTWEGIVKAVPSARNFVHKGGMADAVIEQLLENGYRVTQEPCVVTVRWEEDESPDE